MERPTNPPPATDADASLAAALGQVAAPAGDWAARVDVGRGTGELAHAGVGLIGQAVSKRRPGDLSGDGRVDAADVALVRQAILGLRRLSDVERLAADLDGDGKVDLADLALMMRHLDRAPGDVNGDGQVDAADVELVRKTLLGLYVMSEAEKRAADVDGDGKLAPRDLELLTGWADRTLGDVNGDGQVDAADVELVRQVLRGVASFTPAELAAADLDGDGKLTLADVVRLRRIAGQG